MVMCRTRQEIIDQEAEVQELINLKNKIERGEINGFDNGRKYYEIVKIKSQVESTIREFQTIDDIVAVRSKVNMLEQSTRDGFEKHYSFHRKNPSLIALFRKSPIGMLSFGGAVLVASSLFYVKETRDIMFSLVNLSSLESQQLLNYGFPLFLFLLITGIISVMNTKDKKEES